jgi:hypothetical protein
MDMGVRWRLLAVAAAACALLGGCANSADDGNKVASISTSATPGDQQSNDGKTDEDKMREFAACMREHGIDMEDPTSGPGGGGMSISVDAKDEGKMKAADEACRPLLPNGGKPPKLDAAQLDELRELAKCLREHGLDVAEPSADDPGISIKDGDKAKVDAAHQACGMDHGPGKVNVQEGGK